MDHSSARDLMAIYQRMGAVLNEAEPIIRGLPESPERTKQLRVLGTIMADVWTELMAPIVREHPDLDPDKGSRRE
jgi:hypothetical protein